MSFNLQGVVSVVIRVRNAAADIEQCLLKIRQQILPIDLELEIIVVDNDSTDGSDRIARRYGAKVVNISQKEFTWGRALNLGIENTTGHLIVLLSADAQPADRWWIIEMLRPFSNPNIAAVYGRQVPRKNAPADEQIRIFKKFGDKSLCFNSGNCIAAPTAKGMLVSNTCAAIRKDVWQSNKYDETIEGGEEGLWTCNVLKAGYSFVYQARAIVCHSHSDRIFRFVFREFEIAQKNLVLTGRRLGIIQLFWLAGGVAKRRLKNCKHMEIPIAIRLKGILRLPLEMIAFCAVFLAESLGFGQRCRSLMWG